MSAGQVRNANGRFIKKKMLEKKLKSLSAMSEAKKRKSVESMPKENKVCKGRRMVDIQELAKNLKCWQCSELLSLQRIVDERGTGLHSILIISCEKCDAKTSVPTGKTTTSGYCNDADINKTVVIGKFR